MTIAEWIAASSKLLAQIGIQTHKLDAEIILAHTIKHNRTWLHAHSDEILEPRLREIADARIDLRRDRVPIAYIIGHKEFYGRSFRVNTATLIPRPESETIIELLPLAITSGTERLVDVGTGSGALGITAQLEHPNLDVTLIDIDRHALTVAQKNARLLHADVEFMTSNLLSEYPYQADIIIANLPYVDPDWERSPETNHEPSLALFAEDNGLALIWELFTQLSEKSSEHAFIFLEADPRQHHMIVHHAEKQGMTHIETRGFIVVLQR